MFLVPAAHLKETEDNDSTSVLLFHYNTWIHLLRRKYMETDMFDNISCITNAQDGDGSWDSIYFMGG